MMGVTPCNWKEVKSLQGNSHTSIKCGVDKSPQGGDDRQALAIKKCWGCRQDLGRYLRPWYQGCHVNEPLQGEEWTDLAASWTGRYL